MNLQPRARLISRMFVALALFAWMLTFSPMVNAESPPDSGIIEKIESQLLQIDLTVRGPSQALAGHFGYPAGVGALR